MRVIRSNRVAPVAERQAGPANGAGPQPLGTRRGRLVALAAALVAAGLTALVLTPSLLPGSLALLWLAVPAWQVALTPVWTAAGAYVYLSPMLFAVRRREAIELHAGTVYDFLLQLRWTERGGPARRRVAFWVVRGLLRLGEEVRAGRVAAETRVVVSPYFLGDRSLERLGLTGAPATWPVRLHLTLELIGIAAMYGFVRGRWALPPIWKARTGVGTAGGIAAQRARLLALARRLEPRPSRGPPEPRPPA